MTDSSFPLKATLKRQVILLHTQTCNASAVRLKHFVSKKPLPNPFSREFKIIISMFNTCTAVVAAATFFSSPFPSLTYFYHKFYYLVQASHSSLLHNKAFTITHHFHPSLHQPCRVQAQGRFGKLTKNQVWEAEQLQFTEERKEDTSSFVNI